MTLLKVTIRFVILLIVLCAIGTSAGAIDRFGRQIAARSSGLFLDYAVFKQNHADSIRLEVYYQYHNNLLKFVKNSGVYEASFDIKLRIKDKEGRQAGSAEASRTISVDSEARSRSRSDYRTAQENFILAPGKYTISLIVVDHQADTVHSREEKIKLKSFKEKSPRLSYLELINALAPVGDQPLTFDKGEYTLIPSLTGEYGDGDSSRMIFYFEIYRGNFEADSILVETAIRRRWGGLVYRDSLSTALPDEITRQIREISIRDLQPGEYDVEVRLRGHKNRKIDDKRKTFFISWSEKAMVRNDLKSTMRLLGLIAESKELDTLKKVESAEQRLKLIDEFWLRRDPTPGTPENEVRREFFRRVKIANNNFSFMRQEGWRTDRGQIFVKHGEPDEVNDFPLVPERMPYEEWHYYRGSQYMKFTFVDRNGDGDYRLVYPYDGLNQLPDF